eukprot:Clim_evm24s139 gene=Clim_evmTU24s139
MLAASKPIREIKYAVTASILAKVQVQHDQPVWQLAFDPKTLKRQILPVFVKLDAYLQLLPAHMWFTDPNVKAIDSEIQRHFQRTPYEGQRPSAFLQEINVGRHVPAAWIYYEGRTPSENENINAGREYQSKLARVNQVLVLAAQIKYDVENIQNHKYVAHQIAILYQSLGYAGTTFVSFRPTIEFKFEDIKEICSSSTSPALPPDLLQWIVKTMTDVINACLKAVSQAELLPVLS